MNPNQNQIKSSQTLKDFVSLELIGIFGERIKETLLKYKVGQSKKSDGAALFWLLDFNENVCEGVIFEKDGKQTFLSKMLGFESKQCVFGQHLALTSQNICVVESPKEALIGAFLYPKWVFVCGFPKGLAFADKNIIQLCTVGNTAQNYIDLREIAGGVDLQEGTRLEDIFLNGTDLFLDDYLLIKEKSKKVYTHLIYEADNKTTVDKFRTENENRKAAKLQELFEQYPILQSLYKSFDMAMEFFTWKEPEKVRPKGNIWIPIETKISHEITKVVPF